MRQNISEDDIRKVIPKVSRVTSFPHSGQKQVFRCECPTGNIILKFIRIEDANNGSSASESSELKRVFREIGIIHEISSPYLPTLADISPDYYKINDDQFYYYAENEIPGFSLYDYLKSSKLNGPEVKRLLSHIGQAVKALWENGHHVHRDIKPANIIYNPKDLKFFLIDAGVALALFETSITPTGIAVGTLPYMSPEQVQGTKRSLDFRSDLYSLGLVAYEAASGKHPYWHPGKDSGDTVRSILYDKVDSLMSTGLLGYDDVSLVVDRLLSKSPHMRYKSCDLLLSVL